MASDPFEPDIEASDSFCYLVSTSSQEMGSGALRNKPAKLGHGAVPLHLHIHGIWCPPAQLPVHLERCRIPLEGHVHEGGGQHPASGRCHAQKRHPLWQLQRELMLRKHRRGMPPGMHLHILDDVIVKFQPYPSFPVCHVGALRPLVEMCADPGHPVQVSGRRLWTSRAHVNQNRALGRVCPLKPYHL